MKEEVVLIDANSVIHRAYHALPPLNGKKGEKVNAIYGSLLVFFRVLSAFSPRYMVAAFDLPGKTFRHDMYKEYKAHRPKPPEDLCLQIEKMKEVFHSLGVLVLHKEGYEADDVIGTVCSLIPRKKQAVVVSGDMDVLQLADNSISVYLLKRGVKDISLYGREEVREKYGGVPPEKLVDIKALKGDVSDNIPGVDGVGEKTAVSLVSDFGRVEEVYSSIQKDPSLISSSLYDKLTKNKDTVFVSKSLATIKRDVPLKFELKDARFTFSEEKAVSLLEEFNFKSLINRFPRKQTGKLL